MRCHFVYSVPPVSTAGRISRRVRSALNRAGVPVRLVGRRQPSAAELRLWPAQSPFENTKHIYQALSRKLPTYLYHLSERVPCAFEAEDLLLGHPYFPHDPGRFGITEMAFAAPRPPGTLALISPLHCDTSVETTHINKAYLDDVDRLVPSATVLFGIMGPYWWDRWDTSPYAHWKPKMVRLDMAVDVARFPMLKRRFNRAGRRGYLFIGGSWDRRKGSDYFARLMAAMGDVPCGWIGAGPEIPGVPRISGVRDLTPDFMSRVAEDFDFFVSTAVADPNPTTILECMGWGFPVICTPQSGYYETGYRRNIHLDDLERSVAVLREYQEAPEHLLQGMAACGREAVEREYTWERFCDTITKGLGLS